CGNRLRDPLFRGALTPAPYRRASCRGTARDAGRDRRLGRVSLKRPEGHPASSYLGAAPKWGPPLKGVGGCSELPAALLQIPQAAVEVLAGELPADRPGLATVLGPEGEQACLEVLQVVRHGRRQQLALDDAEEDLDLVQPGGVDGGVDQDQVRV